MGKYHGAVITTAGQNVIAQAISGTELTWTVMRTSSTVIPASTNLETLTSLSGIEQTSNITDATIYGDNVLQVSARFSNTGVSTAYYIQAVGIYGQLAGGSETLIAVMTAVTPDEMPVYDPDAPSAFIFNTQITVQNAQSIVMTVNDTGTATVADLNRKVDKQGGDISDTVAMTATTSTASYPVPAANDTFKVILGKIIKFFSDIKQLNSVTTDGLVPAPTSAKPYRFYSTGGGGNPGWNTGPAFTGASSSSNGISGLVPGPASANYANRNLMYLRSSGEWAFLPLQNNATTTAQYYALDARMGKTLQDQITRLNRNDHYDITLASGTTALGSQTLWIIGSVAILHLCFRSTSALAAYSQIATLPTGNQYSFPGNYATNKWGSTEARVINISSAGVVTLGPQAMATNEHVEFLVIGRAVAT